MPSALVVVGLEDPPLTNSSLGEGMFGVLGHKKKNYPGESRRGYRDRINLKGNYSSPLPKKVKGIIGAVVKSVKGSSP